MKSLTRFAFLLFALLAFAPSLSANSITYILDVDEVNGTYQVYGAAEGDNHGIASFSVELLDIDTIVNESPSVVLSLEPLGPLGFNSARSQSVPLTGAQNLFAGNAILITGIGREAGDLDPDHRGFSVTNPVYGTVPIRTFAGAFAHPVLLGSGTFNSNNALSFGEVSGTVFTTPAPIGGQPGMTAPPEFIETTTVGVGNVPIRGIDADITKGVGKNVEHQFEAAFANDDIPLPIEFLRWSDLVVSGDPHYAPKLTPEGRLTWTTFRSPFGDALNPVTYQFTATATDPVTGFSDTATLTVNLIPEPATSCLFLVATFLAVFSYRRAGRK